jgi:hypothetical protein
MHYKEYIRVHCPTPKEVLPRQEEEKQVEMYHNAKRGSLKNGLFFFLL